MPGSFVVRGIALVLAIALMTLASPGHAQQRPGWLRSYPAADVQRLEGRIDFLSRRDRVSRNSLMTIARSVGLSGSARTLDNIIVAIDDLSKQAGALRTRIETLEKEVLAAKQEPARDLALEALGRALKAIDAGDFDLANREFLTVENLRWSQSEIGLKAWSEAVDARINLARLQYRFDDATALAIRKGQSAARQQAQLGDIEWDAYANAGYSQVLKASATGDIRALYEADRIFDVDLGRLLRSHSTAGRVYQRNLLRGEVKGNIAHRTGSIAVYEESNGLLRLALDYSVAEKCSECFSRVYSHLLSNVSSMIYISRDVRHVEIIRPFIANDNLLLTTLPHYELVSLNYSYSSLFSMIAEIRRDAGAFDKAIFYAQRSMDQAATASDDWSRDSFILSKFQIADIYRQRGEYLNDPAYSAKARDALLELLPQYRRLGRKREEGMVQKRLGAVYYIIAVRGNDCGALRASIAAVGEAMRLMSQADDPQEYSGLFTMQKRNQGLLPRLCGTP
ncbi:hypothetical protein [Sphingomonas sp. G-3-2-10]|uniref:hypothetical protein n=1 Tax=Sphingomonas sp. G-3-2-10 TaxID=2728838 RepID=UPI001469AD65|nr:hypothetical protein [Sphingomonas sp. G-3-2-10]NML06078.1 hypothetical protein [Sphingomonas sp. G-3-2-10]